jgi:hypothetical protein
MSMSRRENASPLTRGTFTQTFGEQGNVQGIEAHSFVLGTLGESAML